MLAVQGCNGAFSCGCCRFVENLPVRATIGRMALRATEANMMVLVLLWFVCGKENQTTHHGKRGRQARSLLNRSQQGSNNETEAA